MPGDVIIKAKSISRSKSCLIVTLSLILLFSLIGYVFIAESKKDESSNTTYLIIQDVLCLFGLAAAISLDVKEITYYGVLQVIMWFALFNNLHYFYNFVIQALVLLSFIFAFILAHRIQFQKRPTVTEVQVTPPIVTPDNNRNANTVNEIHVSPIIINQPQNLPANQFLPNIIASGIHPNQQTLAMYSPEQQFPINTMQQSQPTQFEPPPAYDKP